MSAFRVLVVDDEPLAREMVADLVRADPEVAAVAECGDAAHVKDAIAAHQPDIVFLDIEMPERNGIEIAAGLAPDGPVTVFVTAFDRYATDAFDVRATDYVLKPFSDERFRAALARAKERVRERRILEWAEQSRPESVGAPSGAGATLDRLTLKDGAHSIVIPVAEITWIEAEDYYVRIHSTRGRHFVRATLASLEQRLNPALFIRVHRGAIVNLACISTIRRNRGTHIVLTDGTDIPVSRARRRSLADAVRLRLGAR